MPSSVLLRTRQELQSATNGINEIAMALIASDDVFAGHLLSAAEQFERIGARLRELAAGYDALVLKT